MTVGVALAVLGSALLHGAWNAIAKAIPDRLVSTALIGLVYLVGGGVGCLLLPLPDAAAWPYFVASALVQTGYLVLLTAAYAKADFGRAYPLTRGSAVLGVALVATFVLGERLSVVQAAGVGIMAAAIISLAVVGHGAGESRGGVLLALAVGATITAYSIIDGVGVRTGSDPLSYAAWLFLLQGVAVPVTCVVLARDRRAFGVGLRRSAGWGVLGGALSLVAYTVVVWAQSLAPLALVSALRESGVLMAGVIGWLVFREPFSRWRTVATLAAVVGIVAVNMG